MTITIVSLIPPKVAEDSQETQYTATGKKAIIDKFTVTNTTGADVLISINLVPANGTPTSDNLILKDRDIGAGETYLCPEVIGHVLEDGDYISTIANAPYSLTIMASGREIT